MAQVEPGVHITCVSLPNGGNDLKWIRFSREMFNKWQAQQWWGEDYYRIMELYNVQRFNRQALHTFPRSEDEGFFVLKDGINKGKSHASLDTKKQLLPYNAGSSAFDPSWTSTSSRDEPPSVQQCL